MEKKEKVNKKRYDVPNFLAMLVETKNFLTLFFAVLLTSITSNSITFVQRGK